MPEKDIDEARLLQLMNQPFWLGKACRGAEPKVIRGVLAMEHTTAWHLFLKLAVPLDVTDERLAIAWVRALETISGLQAAYGWGSKPKKDKLARVAADPVMLAAVQGTVAHAEDAILDMLAVLVIDASKESLDALVGHFERAVEAEDRRLDRLQRLRKHARSTPALDALFAEVEGRLDARAAASPALALGPIIGVGAVDVLWFRVTIVSQQQTTGRVSRVQGNVSVDSRSPTWLAVSLSHLLDGPRIPSTYFTDKGMQRDDLGLGTCEVAHLPHWLAAAATKLDVRWDDAPHISSNLRGKLRDRVVEWLLHSQPTT